MTVAVQQSPFMGSTSRASECLHVVHLMASPFVGGPERQALGLARHLPSDVKTTFLSFAERGLSQALLDEARGQGFEAIALRHNTPRFFACVREVADELRELKADLLLCSGYKPDLVGWQAARLVGIPVVSISHGWTSATWKVRCYEKFDQLALRWMDAVVCVSQAQADKVRHAGVPAAKIKVIHNAIGEEAFRQPRPEVRQQMLGWFAQPPRWIIGAAGRFSPEKGFSVLIEAAAVFVEHRPDAGVVLFGDGPLRGELERSISARGLAGKFILAGFRKDLHEFLPNLDVNVMSSFTEGLPVILLEASAAGVPTVATAVGGIPEVIEHGQSGYLVPPGDPMALAQRIVELLANDSKRQSIGRAACERAREEFSLPQMGQRYLNLFHALVRCA